MYSELNTRNRAFYRVLQQGRELKTEHEVMELVDHCMDVFAACDLQLPTYLAQRLADCNCSLEDFLDYAFEMIAPEGSEIFHQINTPERLN